MSTQHEVDNPPTELITALSFSSDGTRIAVASWNRDISIYDNTTNHDTFTFSGRRIRFRAPVLDICWGEDNDTLYAVGTDFDVRRVKLSEGAGEDQAIQQVLSTHTKPSNKIAYSSEHGVLISISWDGTMHVHTVSDGVSIRVRLAAKPFAISLSADKAVVAMAERKVSVYDLQALKSLTEQAGTVANGKVPSLHDNVLEVAPWQQRESSLRYMTRDVACMPNGLGFATSSIEGRVAVEWFDPEAQSKTYAFKCHRQTTTLPADENGEEQQVDMVYPVNALAFHPVHGTFATGGGDGVVYIWDASTKRRVRHYPNMGASVAAVDFSPDGEFMAVGICPGVEDGKDLNEVVNHPESIKVIIRKLSPTEAKGKPAK
ncbi:mitotic spindle checkpoint protein Bub3 [Recurvomyces mirabilis]|uniref:Mitotic spindle checkpoint protein Bub3 n=1 Tax=Recurvomyces mirabilis TaxID=574656 RepID=A0AAE0TPI4_9PEZI|nr:mitotic spindle checkpoint protein Bub3 [Recurvomyces mirabilis]KAK5160805.1 mitotic spindle checkpoint protein Bub3 [Recurvomyces mirabilis]